MAIATSCSHGASDASDGWQARGFGASSFLITDEAEAMAKAAFTFDVILHTVSGNAPLDPYLGLLKPRGKLACVGLPDKSEKSQVTSSG